MIAGWADITNEMKTDAFGRPVVRACMNIHTGDLAWSTGGLLACLDCDERVTCMPVEVADWLLQPIEVTHVPAMEFSREGECFACEPIELVVAFECSISPALAKFCDEANAALARAMQMRIPAVAAIDTTCSKCGTTTCEVCPDCSYQPCFDTYHPPVCDQAPRPERALFCYGRLVDTEGEFLPGFCLEGDCIEDLSWLLGDAIRAEGIEIDRHGPPMFWWEGVISFPHGEGKCPATGEYHEPVAHGRVRHVTALEARALTVPR